MALSNKKKSNFSLVKSTLLLRNTWFRRIVKTIWILFFLFVTGVPLYVYMVSLNPFNLFGELPPLRQIENPENDLSSELISADGVSLGRYFSFDRRQIAYRDLPPLLVNTLLISEDHRFYDHSGMDFWSYLRVIYGLATFNMQGGGSTLTQQTAKNLYRTRSEELQGSLAKLDRRLDLLISKTKEWIIAVKLEQNFTKEEIIAMYLNTVPFNNNAYGIKVATETYFGKELRELTIPEAALLVGMLQGTERFNPIEYPERAKDKRNDVLRKLYDHHYIKSRKTYDSLCQVPLQLNFSVHSHNEGMATYFRTVLRNTFLTRWCRENGYDLLESGLKIYTTIDSRYQRMAEEALTTNMKRLQKDFDAAWGNDDPWGSESDFLQRRVSQSGTYKRLAKRYGANSDSLKIMLNMKRPMRVFSWDGSREVTFSVIDSVRYYNRFLHAGLMSMDPQTGEVKAWVGGINHRYFKFDHVHQGKRQAGSTFKAFVYGKAMEDGMITPCYELFDNSPSIRVNGTVYRPPNSNGTYGDGNKYTMRKAMARSLNSITMQLMEQVHPENVAAFAQRLGIESELDPVYSLGLGTSDVALDEMVAAYCSFVNLGIHTKPYMITRIEDKYGKVIASFVPSTHEAMNEETAYKMVYMLRGGVEEAGGTSNKLSDEIVDNNEVGGKTGTTNNASDGWYIGITHNLVTGVWVGGEERSIRFPNWGEGSGGRTALPIFDTYMTKMYKAGFPKGKFKQPSENTNLGNLKCDEEEEQEL
jgi:penicillin-binding protein 1A